MVVMNIMRCRKALTEKKSEGCAYRYEGRGRNKCEIVLIHL